MRHDRVAAFVVASLTALPAYGQIAPADTGKAKPPPELVAATRVRTAHLEVSTRNPEGSVVPGTPFSLVLDIKPRRGIHVYAPGAADYRVIELAMTPMEGVTFRPVQFPPSEIYDFVPLNERIPVYQQPFQLTQSVTVDMPSGEPVRVTDGLTVAIKAVLNYQACDDRICFAPVSVPLSWTVPIKRGGE